jgi:LacI family transcriptional regulator
MVTITDVARHAGVSKATVSRVLNGRPDVDARTAMRIRATIAELGYVPSARGRALASGRAGCIGFLVPSLTLPWLLEVLRGVADAVEAAGFAVTLHTTSRGTASLASFAAQVRARAIDGVVAAAACDLRLYLADLRDEGVPVVLIADHADPAFPTFWATDRAGGYEAARHLLALGRWPIAAIAGPAKCHGARERVAGYRQALAEAGRSPSPDLIEEGDWTEAGGAAAMDALLARRPDLRAVFAANDRMAFGATRAIVRSGRAIPADVAVVGYGDIPAAEHTTPPLTTIGLPFYDLGCAASRALLGALAGDSLSPSFVRLPTALVVRGTCGAPAVAGAPTETPA